MDDSSRFQPPAPRSLKGVGDSSEVAEAADIPSPPEKVLEEELAAQARRKDLQDFGTLPRNLMEAVHLVQAMEREGKRINNKALMEFLKDRPGDTISADLLVAMGLLMEAIAQRQKKKKSFFSKVVDFFKGHP
jgi:hypothetical protein